MVYSPLLNAATREWILGKIESHQAVPLTRDEIEELAKLLNELPAKEAELQEARHSNALLKRLPEAMAALRELVGLKRMKETITYLRDETNESGAAERLEKRYEASKEAAWDAAKALVK